MITTTEEKYIIAKIQDNKELYYTTSGFFVDEYYINRYNPSLKKFKSEMSAKRWLKEFYPESSNFIIKKIIYKATI